MKEKISALLDAELKGRERDRVLAELNRDSGLRKVWERYHLISAALRNELAIVVAPKLADRVAEKIKTESALTPPLPRFIPQGRNNTRRTFAIAASVVVIVLTLPFIIPFAPNEIPQNTTSSFVADTGLERNYARTDVRGEPRSDWEKALDTFLVEHNEHTPISVMNSMMSYVRLAGFDNEKE